MRPTTNANRRSTRSWRGGALALLLVVAACESSVVPSASPSAAVATPSAVESPSSTDPASSPEATAQVDPSPDAQEGDFVPGALAVTVSDRLRVRSAPRVADDSIRYAPVLPVGTELEVIEGPVEASGYTWVHVRPVGITLDDGATDGWVAIADHDGTPWVEESAAPLAGLAVAQSSVERAPVNVADAKRTAAGVNAFGVDLYRRLLKDPDADLDGKGVSMSPVSIAAALAMARAGAEGATASQMDDMLRTSGWNDLGSGVGSLQQILNGYNATWTDEEDATHASR